MSKQKPCTVKYTPSEVIADQLLVVLSDKAKVACIFDLNALDAVIEALSYKGQASFRTETQTGLLRDLIQLRSAAFPEAQKR